jgi:hypothetical protein
LVRSQLDKVLASELFSRSERLSGFLRFVVEETLNGRGETLKEPVLAHELYGKEADFDGATNPIVRVDARRLRDKLREYYADQTGDPVVIALPKGSYVPTFDRAADTPPAPDIQFQAVEPTSVDVAFREPAPDIDTPTSALSRMSVWRGVVCLRWEWRRCSPAATQRSPRTSRGRPHRPGGSCWRSCRFRT